MLDTDFITSANTGFTDGSLTFGFIRPGLQEAYGDEAEKI